MKKQILSILLILLLSMGLISTAMAVGGANDGSEAEPEIVLNLDENGQPEESSDDVTPPDGEAEEGEEPEYIEFFEEEYISCSDLELDGFPSDEELFAGYVQKIMDESIYGDSGAFFGRLAREQLDDFNKLIYDQIAEGIQQVAAGERSSAVFPITFSQEVVDSELTVSGNGQEDILNKLRELISSKINSRMIMTALLNDHPYALYWFNKSASNAFSYGYGMSIGGHDGNDYTYGMIGGLSFTLQVIPTYQAAGYDSKDPAVDTAKASAAAQLIVDPNDERETNVEKALAAAAGCSTDYEKIMAFAQWICNNTDYNDEAASDTWQDGYSDPWQLLYVFDGLPGTKVVCEGYSKAFQYLCDLSGIECYSVAGWFGENHMWNIVRLNGQSYIVDVTNSDEGTVGNRGGELLVGYASSGSVTEGYTISSLSGNLEYFYDNDTLALWGSDAESILKLATAEYEEPSVASLTKGEGEPSYYSTLDAAVTEAEKCTAEDEAVLTLLDDIDLGEEYQEISSGVFTLDLNGFTLSSTKPYGGALHLNGSDTVLTITDSSEEKSGSISGEEVAFEMYDGILNISGGSISGGTVGGGSYDIFFMGGAITLSLPEGGEVGATFPGGIEVYGTTLKAILGEGAAYWQGDTVILPADDAKEISGGDVSIKAAPPSYTIAAIASPAGGGTVSGAGDYLENEEVTLTAAPRQGYKFVEWQENGRHFSIDERIRFTATADRTLVAVFEKLYSAASLCISGDDLAYYGSLQEAIEVAKNCTAEDNAVLTLLDDIEGSNCYFFDYGVFTLDLNGFEIRSTDNTWGAIYVTGAKLTIIDSSEEKSGSIIGNIAAVESSSTLNIAGGNFIATGNDPYGFAVAIYGGMTNISGGSFSGNYDLDVSDGSCILSLPEGGEVGATFPGGIEVYGTTLKAILGEGAAYWQGNTRITPADDATEITGGDVTIKAAPPLASFSIDKAEYSIADNFIYFTFDISEETPNGKFVLYIDGAPFFNNYGFAYSGSPLTGKSVVFAILPKPHTGEHTMKFVFVPTDSAQKGFETNTVSYKINKLSAEELYKHMWGDGETTAEYDGTPKYADVRSIYVEGQNTFYLSPEEFSVSYWQGEKQITEPTKVGSYEVKISVTENDVYQKVEDYSFGALNILPGKPEISFPTASGLILGQSLADSTLSGGSTEYGSFAWEDANTKPELGSKEYTVIFTPKDTVNYDYSGVEGWDASSKTVKRGVSVSVVEPTVYTVLFDANGGSVSPESASTEANGSCQLAELPTPSWPGYTFLGWFDAAEGGNAISTDTVFTQDNSTIYAQWRLAYWTDEGNYDLSWYDPAEYAYTISNGAELAGLAVLANGLNGQEHVDFSYKQINLDSDIDLSAYLWTPIGSSDEKLFTGTFYGAGKTISGLRIDAPAEDFYVGLFGYATATLRDFHVTDASVKNSKTGYHTGGIVGYLGTTPGYAASCMLMNCSFSGIVEGPETTGGLAGSIHGAQILKSVNYGEVTGGMNTGGLVGSCYGWVDKSYNLGDVSGSTTVGGIAGDLQGGYSIKNSYNLGQISDSDPAGGIVGYEYGSSISNCYYLDSSATTGVDSGSAAAKSGAAAKSSAAFASGEVAFLLNEAKTSGQAFFQNLDNGEPVDTYPVFSGGTVYGGYKDCGDTEKIYSNSPLREDSEHSFDESGKCVYCGSQAVASLTKGEGEPTYYATLDAAVTEARNCTAEDEAVLTLLDDIDLGENNQSINSGTFTLDLNGFTLSSTHSFWGVLYVSDSATKLTIIDSSEEKSGSISGKFSAVEVSGSTVNISGGSFRGLYPVKLSNGTANISGGSFSGEIYALSNSDGTVNITGGSFIGAYDISCSGGVTTLSLPEGGEVGAIFPGGITVSGTTLNALLGEGAAYWQGDTVILPADDAKEISGGDVSIKKICDHSGNTNSGTDNGDGTHNIACSECSVEFITNEAHRYSFSAEQHVLSISCTKCDMKTVEISLVAPADLVYDGSAKVVTTSGSAPGLTLAAVEYCCEDGCINVGMHTASLRMGKATAERTFEIEPATPSISWAEASETLVYTGSPAAITAPAVSLVNGETYSGEIIYSYTVEGETEEKDGLPTDVGSYSVKASIPAAGNYTAAESNDRLSLTITAKAIEAVNISVSGLEESYDYTGQPIQPEVSVLVDGNAISEADYEVSYGENTNVADGGTVKVTLKHNYSGEQSFSFAINAVEQADFRILGPLSAIYGDAPIQLSTEGGSGDGAISWEITSGSEYASIDAKGLLSILGAGSVTVQATKAADGNYLAASDSHSIQIGKATAEAGDFTYTAPADLVYSRSAKVATVTGKEGFGQITVKYYSDSEMSTEAEPIHVGTYYVGITMAESDNYAAITAPMAMGEFTIVPKALNVTADERSRKYGEENPELTYEAPELIEGDSLEGELFTEATKDSDVGEYEISQGTLANADYEISFTGAMLTIEQADGPIAPTVTGSYVDDGMTYTFTVDVIENAEYSLDGESWTDSNVFENLTAGQSYIFYARIKETKNFKAGQIGSSAEIDLEKLSGQGSVTMESWIYGEKAKDPVVESSTGNQVESYLYESTDGQGYSSAEVPTNAGDYQVTVNFGETTTHNGTKASAEFRIAKASPQAETPANLSATYGDTLEDVELPEGWDWEAEPSTPVGNVEDENEFTVIYTHPTEPNNYEELRETVEITVSPKEVTASIQIVEGSYVYNGSAHRPLVTVKDGESTVPGSEYTVEYQNNVNAGTATVLVKDNAGGNYTISGQSSFVIKKAASSDPAAVEREFLRTIATFGNVVNLEALLPDDHGTVTYTVVKGNSAILDGVTVDANGKLVFDTKTADAPSSSEITVDVVMENYEDITLTVLVSLTGKETPQIIGVSAAEGLRYSGKPQKGYIGAPRSKYTGNYEIFYTGRGNSYSSVLAPTEAGDYTVTFKIPESDLYYAGSLSLNFSIGKAPLKVIAEDKVTQRWGEMPELSYKVLGLIGEDTVKVTLKCDADLKQAGEYPILVSAVDASGNYEIEAIDGILTVEARPYRLDVDDKDDKEDDDQDDDKKPGKPGKPGHSGSDSEECQRGSLCPLYPFQDVDRNAWYHDGLHYVVEEGLMQGMSSSSFAPNLATSRAMIVTILWRLEGSPMVDYAMGFQDVAADMWYTEAIRWAASTGLVTGYSETAFGPNDSITREQMATILYRYAQYKGYSLSGSASIQAYGDAAAVSDWAKAAMEWACGKGLIQGSNNLLDPQGDAIRAQSATILYRFCEMLDK